MHNPRIAAAARRMKKALTRLGNPPSSAVSHSEGETIIEFAIVLPIFLMFLMGTMEYGMVMYAQSVLDGGLSAAAREGATGYTGSGGQSQYQYVFGVLSSRIQGLLDPNQVQLNVVSQSTLNVTGIPAPCMNNPPPPPPTIPKCSQNLGAGGDVSVYTASYPWPVITPFLQAVLGQGIYGVPTPGTFWLSASAVVKNEPYPSR
jgi:Flp pilus assembly protein TadG